MRTIHPVHKSIGRPVTPYNMERIKCPHEVKESLTILALEIFTDCCNAGHTFQDALLAIYVSGLQHAQGLRETSKEP